MDGSFPVVYAARASRDVDRPLLRAIRAIYSLCNCSVDTVLDRRGHLDGRKRGLLYVQTDKQTDTTKKGIKQTGYKDKTNKPTERG